MSVGVECLVGMLQGYRPSMSRIRLTVPDLLDFLRARLKTATRIRVFELNPASKRFEDSDLSPEQIFEMIQKNGNYHATQFVDGSIAVLVGSAPTYSITIFP